MTYTTLVYHPRLADKFAEAVVRAGHTDPLVVAHDEAELAQLLPSADVAFSWRLPHALLAAHGTRLRWLQNGGAGVDDLLAGELPPDLVITRIVDAFSEPMAEYVIGQLLAHTLRLRRAWEQQREQVWKPYGTRLLGGRRLGVAGVGSIGLTVAAKAKALGMEVWGLARTPGERPHLDRTFLTGERLEFCRGLDALAVVLPLTPETEGMFGADEFAALPAGSFFINVGRGRLVDETALLAALDNGHLGGAALDVFATEPLPPGHPFWLHPLVTVTPHVSGLTHPDIAARVFVDNYRRFVAGEPLRGVVDRSRGY